MTQLEINLDQAEGQIKFDVAKKLRQVDPSNSQQVTEVIADLKGLISFAHENKYFQLLSLLKRKISSLLDSTGATEIVHPHSTRWGTFLHGCGDSELVGLFSLACSDKSEFTQAERTELVSLILVRKLDLRDSVKKCVDLESCVPAHLVVAFVVNICKHIQPSTPNGDFMAVIKSIVPFLNECSGKACDSLFQLLIQFMLQTFPENAETHAALEDAIDTLSEQSIINLVVGASVTNLLPDAFGLTDIIKSRLLSDPQLLADVIFATTWLKYEVQVFAYDVFFVDIPHSSQVYAALIFCFDHKIDFMVPAMYGFNRYQQPMLPDVINKEYSPPEFLKNNVFIYYFRLLKLLKTPSIDHKAVSFPYFKGIESVQPISQMGVNRVLSTYIRARAIYDEELYDAQELQSAVDTLREGTCSGYSFMFMLACDDKQEPGFHDFLRTVSRLMLSDSFDELLEACARVSEFQVGSEAHNETCELIKQLFDKVFDSGELLLTESSREYLGIKKDNVISVRDALERFTTELLFLHKRFTKVLFNHQGLLQSDWQVAIDALYGRKLSTLCISAPPIPNLLYTSVGHVFNKLEDTSFPLSMEFCEKSHSVIVHCRSKFDLTLYDSNSCIGPAHTNNVWNMLHIVDQSFDHIYTEEKLSGYYVYFRSERKEAFKAIEASKTLDVGCIACTHNDYIQAAHYFYTLHDEQYYTSFIQEYWSIHYVTVEYKYRLLFELLYQFPDYVGKPQADKPFERLKKFLNAISCDVKVEFFKRLISSQWSWLNQDEKASTAEVLDLLVAAELQSVDGVHCQGFHQSTLYQLTHLKENSWVIFEYLRITQDIALLKLIGSRLWLSDQNQFLAALLSQGRGDAYGYAKVQAGAPVSVDLANKICLIISGVAVDSQVQLIKVFNESTKLNYFCHCSMDALLDFFSYYNCLSNFQSLTLLEHTFLLGLIEETLSAFPTLQEMTDGNPMHVFVENVRRAQATTTDIIPELGGTRTFPATSRHGSVLVSALKAQYKGSNRNPLKLKQLLGGLRNCATHAHEVFRGIFHDLFDSDKLDGLTIPMLQSIPGLSQHIPLSLIQSLLETREYLPSFLIHHLASDSPVDAFKDALVTLIFKFPPAHALSSQLCDVLINTRRPTTVFSEAQLDSLLEARYITRDQRALFHFRNTACHVSGVIEYDPTEEERKMQLMAKVLSFTTEPMTEQSTTLLPCVIPLRR